MAERPIIIIKKVTHGHAAHHGGAWKVAYADFVTAMMAFFLVMWIVGQNTQARDAVAQYFRDPGVFETTRGQGLMPGRTGTPREVEVTPASEAALTQAAAQVRQALEQMPGFLEIADRVKIEMTDEGLRIELLDRAKDGFFDSGSADLKPQMIEVLRVIGAELGREGHLVAIDGYSDSRAYRGDEFYDNWTLSADRANAARRVLEQTGLRAGQVDAVRGFADTRLRHPEDPLDPRNRRISIVVKPGRSVQ